MDPPQLHEVRKITYHLPADNDVPPLREQVGTVVIGAVAGLAAVAFHAVMNLAESVRTELAVFATAHGMAAQFGVILTCGVLAATAVFLVHRFAIAGFCALSSGMPLGREGPSVQIGAMSAIVLRQFGIGLVYFRRRTVELGAAAGLAAAFNAPLSGVVFSFELL